MKNVKEYIGELVGTFILVSGGCAAVGISILTDLLPNIFFVAVIWGAVVSFAIFALRSICSAHFNPAVSFAMWLSGRLSLKRMYSIIVSQLIGAIIAAIFLYILFRDLIGNFEAKFNIIRGANESSVTARMFGEFYQPNSLFSAMSAEGAGTFLFVLLILFVSQKSWLSDKRRQIAPLLIGAGLAILICIFASTTQAGFNPARDFGPRLVAFFCGWGEAAFPDQSGGFLGCTSWRRCWERLWLLLLFLHFLNK